MKKMAPYYRIGLMWLGLVGVAFAQKVSRFHKQPSARVELVEKLATRAATDKREAKAWAQARGLPMRTDDGKKLRELVAVRNGKPLYLKTHNSKAAISTATDSVGNTSPYNLTGAGVKVGVWDGGEVLTTHQEFNGRVEDKDDVGSHYHATHVGGTIGAFGIQSNAKGMAPAVLIDSYDWSDDLAEMANAAASAPGEANTLYLSNHSYGFERGWEDGTFNGYDEFGQYNYYARETDEIVDGHQYYLPFFSAGNDRNDAGDATHPGDGVYKDGYDTVADYAIAKNVMTVGAVNDAASPSGDRYLPGATMTSFSSWGPADDGRIKPDIVANGSLLYSCDDDNNSDYVFSSGTSMASPNACGSAVLLVEYYKELFPDGAMRASTLKGLIIHTADDLGNPGPDYSFGWGLMNTLAAVELLADYSFDPTRLVEASVTTAQKSDSYTFFSDGNEPVRVTLCWTDPPGRSTSSSDSRTSRLVNDLDLTVVGPGGTFLPYKLDYNNPSANATTGENNIDNVEQVYIAASVAGEYTITVNFDGTSVSGGEQWYSLLVSGPGSDSDGDGMSNFWERQYFGGATNAVASADSDGDGMDNLSEYIAGYSPIDSDSVFKVTLSGLSEVENVPYIMTWNPVAGRIYDVSWSPNLIITPFDPLPFGADLLYPVNSYTDTVERAGRQNFYRVDVRLVE